MECEILKSNSNHEKDSRKERRKKGLGGLFYIHFLGIIDHSFIKCILENYNRLSFIYNTNTHISMPVLIIDLTLLDIFCVF